MNKKAKKSLARRLAAYSLAGGAVALASQATPAAAAMTKYDNGGAGWEDATSDWQQDSIAFKMDGTVYVNTANEYLPGGNPKDADTFAFQRLDFLWYGTDEKDAVCLNIGENVGYVGGTGYAGAEWDVGRLGAGYVVGGDTLADSRVWSDRAVTDTGGLRSWNFYFHGEWPFGDSGYIGLYADDDDGRHYGWADVTLDWQGPWPHFTLGAFAFSDSPDQAVWAGAGEVLIGDTDKDGDVDWADYQALEAGFGTGTTWAQGDFDGDGDVDWSDYQQLEANFGAGTSGIGNLGSGEPVPEPMTLSVLALGAAGLLASRRRRA